MEQLKVKKKDVIVRNAALFLCLALGFLYLQYAYRYHISPFSVVYLRKSAELFWYIGAPVVVSVVLIWSHHRLALMAYVLSVSLIGYKVTEGLFMEFNKIIVISLFFYVVISYFIYQLLRHYYLQASINPNFSRSDLFEPLLRNIPCELIDHGVVHPGFLTNWDSDGCFIKLGSLKKFSPKILIKVNFQGRDFLQEGELVAHSIELKGVGIKFKQTAKDMNVFNWTEFSELIDELGFQPERLR
ncbi:MAG TPA: hypothetical protein VNJ01_14555 [Bacteriovoracaceae bacterium]|nr:hypothetical protein [Bacteriovoracaceae bacterium]